MTVLVGVKLVEREGSATDVQVSRPDATKAVPADRCINTISLKSVDSALPTARS